MDGLFLAVCKLHYEKIIIFMLCQNSKRLFHGAVLFFRKHRGTANWVVLSSFPFSCCSLRLNFSLPNLTPIAIISECSLFFLLFRQSFTISLILLLFLPFLFHFYSSLFLSFSIFQRQALDKSYLLICYDELSCFITI